MEKSYILVAWLFHLLSNKMIFCINVQEFWWKFRFNFDLEHVLWVFDIHLVKMLRKQLTYVPIKLYWLKQMIEIR